MSGSWFSHYVPLFLLNLNSMKFESMLNLLKNNYFPPASSQIQRKDSLLVTGICFWMLLISITMPGMLLGLSLIVLTKCSSLREEKYLLSMPNLCPASRIASPQAKCSINKVKKWISNEFNILKMCHGEKR